MTDLQLGQQQPSIEKQHRVVNMISSIDDTMPESQTSNELCCQMVSSEGATGLNVLSEVQATLSETVTGVFADEENKEQFDVFDSSHGELERRRET